MRPHLKPLLLALGVVSLLALAAPAFAAAATFGVNTAADSGNPLTPCNGVEECTLRQAIKLADENAGVDNITFNAFPAGEHELLVEAPLPPITEAVRIEGDTAPGATAGVPAIELVPIIAASAGPGLSIVGTKGTRIEGLAIGGFATGIEIAPEEAENALETQICGDYIGTEWLGESARPNEVGIKLTNDGFQWAEKTEIGGPGCAENVISGNSVDGIRDAGIETTIAGNRIGIGAEPLGGSLGNGTADASESAGIYETASASRNSIGGGAGRNLIDGNVGAGVLVEKGSSQVTISENSFTGNAHSGIEILEGAPPAPASVAAESPTTEHLKVTGTIGASTEAGETVRLEVFASDNCSQPGEGRTFLGSGNATPPSTAPVGFSTELPVDVPIDEKGITLTATHENGATSEFSNCANYAGAPRIFLVNSLGDASTQAGCEAGDATCTLRGAIQAANATEARDTIEFGVAGVIEPLTELPEIGQPVSIDGTSAPGYAGQPLVEIKGPEPNAFGILLTAAARGSTVSGLAIGGFRIGVVLNGSDQRVCGSYLGVGLDGTTAVPNHVGVSIEEGTTGDEVGAGCEEIGDGNLLSGNTYGITDFGSQTLIAANRIGIDATGAELPNGDPRIEGAGITVERLATAAIGPASLEGANTIAHNVGPGILVARPAAKAAIHGNPIFDNELQGIETANEVSAPPKVTKVKVGANSLTVEGEATSAGVETIELDFFASPACSSVPEAQTYLGQWNVSGVAGTNDFEAELAGELPTGEEFITVTSTGSVGGQTTEFSECFHYQAPVGEHTFTVSGLGDNPGRAGCEDESAATECTLRGAIEAANETEALDTIKFAAGGEGVIRVEDSPLPPITNPAVIDGSSAPGWAGEPLVEVDGTGASNDGPVWGLEATHGETLIEGLAIGGFADGGIHLGWAGDSQVCASWLGVGLGGADLPNGAGVEVEEGSSGNTIGGGCGGVVYNYIAGNEGWGVKDFGRETRIGNDDIGISPAQGADGNGEGGILVGEEADETTIGSELGGAPGPNVIAYNGGPGVEVERGFSRATIRGNSIFGNAGKGIAIGEEAPAVPTIEAVESGSGTITVKGAVIGGEEEPIELDVFASAVCSPLTAGEGESFLGHAEIALSNPDSNPFVGTVAPPASDDQIYITVTATAGLAHRTSEFSECFKYVPPEPEPEPEPEHHEETKPPAQNSATTPPVTPTLNTTPEFTPTNGEKVVVKPEEGKVTIKLPGTNKSVPLEELKEIPVGAVIDATKGRVTLTSVDPDGKEQTAEFFDGLFKVKQAEGANMVVLELLDTGVCPAPKAKRVKSGKGKGGSPRAFASSVSLRPATATTGKLWGSGHGNFRTEGHDGSATVRGTSWLVEDRCNGTTFFKTRRGIVSVRDFLLHKTLPLPAGKSYVAGEE